MSRQTVVGQILVRNGTMVVPTVVTEPINCNNITIRGMEWLVPILDNNGFHTGYGRVQDKGVKPQADAIKALRITDHNNADAELYIALPDAGVVKDFQDKCNECCGSGTPVLDVVTYPTVIEGASICPNDAGEYILTAIMPANPGGLKYTVKGSFNGAIPAVAAPTTLADAAAIKAWLIANWAAYGTWDTAVVGGVTKVFLTSTTTKSGMVTVELVPAKYCVTLPAVAATVDRIVIGGVETTFPPTVLDRANPAAVFMQLQRLGVLIGTLIIRTDTPVGAEVPKYQYEGLQVPATLKDGATTVATWNAGVCS